MISVNFLLKNRFENLSFFMQYSILTNITCFRVSKKPTGTIYLIYYETGLLNYRRTLMDKNQLATFFRFF